MKRFLIASLFAATLLGACTPGQVITNPTIQGTALSATSTSVRQASSLKAAGGLYVLAVTAVVQYYDSGYADKAIERQITPIEAQLHNALIDGQEAEVAGNSPAAGAALSLFNANYAKLAALLPALK